MKKKTYQIAITYTLFSIFVVIVCDILLQKHTSEPFYYIIKDVLFVLFSGIMINIILLNKDTRSNKVFKRLTDTNTKIKESNERYDIVSKATSDTIWDWKIGEDKIIWNRGLEEVFGYTENEIGDNSTWWFSKIHPEDSIKMSVKLYSFIGQKTDRWQDQYRLRCADGSYKYVLDRGFILQDENRNVYRMIGAIQDITKQKEEEQRLKLLETVITNTRNSIIITEPKSNDGNVPKIVYANPAFSIMTGYPTNEIIGKSPGIFKGPNSDDNEYKKLATAIQNEEECEVETISYKKNKDEYWVNFSMLPVSNEEGVITHWISIQRDISEDKKQEIEKEQLIRELTQNNKDLRQFSYITSHNLRAPLSNLIGLLNLTDEIPIENQELKEILNGFNKSTHLLNETINDLVKVIIIKDNPSIQKENILLKEIFENVFSQLDFLISLHKPIIKFDFKDVTFLNTNKAYIESILLNLLTNSIKYKSEKRKLKISITANNDGNQVVLVFNDNGIGIDLVRNKDRIFGLYQRFHDFPDSKGLGLYLVKSQVETMGGTIKVESEVDKGTTFTITFKI